MSPKPKGGSWEQRRRRMRQRRIEPIKKARRQRRKAAKIGYFQGKRRQRVRKKGLPAPFIVGMTRSGTTLLRLMLDSHPELTIPPETHFIPDLIGAFNRGDDTPETILPIFTENRRWGDFGLSEKDLLKALKGVEPLDKPSYPARVFYQLYAKKQGKKRWGDKTPGYATKLRRIQRTLREAHFIHMIRDGRDVALSLEQRQTGLTTEQVARRWRHRINRTRRAAKEVPNYIEVRYEDLVTNPEATLERVCQFLKLDYHPKMLEYHRRAEDRLSEIERELPQEEEKRGLSAESRVEAHQLTSEPPRADHVALWKERMSQEDLAVFDEHAGELLTELGYGTAT
jgi:sulfotransferase family protein